MIDRCSIWASFSSVYPSSTVNAALQQAAFGEGTGPINLDDVLCTGSESWLLNCQHLTNHNCGHHEDAGVRCGNHNSISYTY